MVRIFTTSFNYNHQLYDAIVTVKSKDDKMQFTIKVMDADLHAFLPEGLVQYVGQDGYKNISYLKNPYAQSVLQSIAEAISHHVACPV